MVVWRCVCVVITAHEDDDEAVVVVTTTYVSCTHRGAVSFDVDVAQRLVVCD